MIMNRSRKKRLFKPGIWLGNLELRALYSGDLSPINSYYVRIIETVYADRWGSVIKPHFDVIPCCFLTTKPAQFGKIIANTLLDVSWVSAHISTPVRSLSGVRVQ